MAYFPVDDRFHAHPKAAAASLAAIGLWAVAGSWARGSRQDGDIPEHMIASLSRGSTELADELVSCGLWRRTKAGYRFHQWAADGDGTPRNILKAEQAIATHRKSTGGQLGNHRRWHARRGVVEADCVFCEPPTRPNAIAPPIAPRSEVRSLSESLPPHPTPKKKKSSRPAPPTDDDPDFAAFWAAYPLKKDKGQARKDWPKAVQLAAPEEIILAARRFADRRRGEDPKYTPYPATWLNGERWRDEEPVRRASSQPLPFWEA